MQYHVSVTRTRADGDASWGRWKVRCKLSVVLHTRDDRRVSLGSKSLPVQKLFRQENDFQLSSLKSMPLKQESQQIATFLNIPMNEEDTERRPQRIKRLANLKSTLRDDP